MEKPDSELLPHREAVWGGELFQGDADLSKPPRCSAGALGALGAHAPEQRGLPFPWLLTKRIVCG